MHSARNGRRFLAGGQRAHHRTPIYRPVISADLDIDALVEAGAGVRAQGRLDVTEAV
jgi:hypothetical protein